MNKLIITCLLILFARVSFVSANFDDINKYFDEFFSNASSSLSIIKTTVNANSNTGSNVTESGTFVAGKSEASLRVKTIINGKTVEDVDIGKTSDDGNQDIIYDSNIEVKDNKVKVEIRKEINGEKENNIKEFVIEEGTKNKIINIVNNTSEQKIINTDEQLQTIFISENEQPDLVSSTEMEQREGDSYLSAIINIIFGIFRNSIDRIVKLF